MRAANLEDGPLVGHIREERDVPMGGPAERPLEDLHHRVRVEQAKQHPDQRGGGCLDQHPAEIFEMFEEGLDGAPALIRVIRFGLVIVGTFCHEKR